MPDQERDPLSAILNYEAVADRGVFNFEGISIFATPQSTVKIMLIVEGIETYGNTIDFIDSAPEITLEVRKCIEGENYGNNLSCLPC